MANDCLKTTLKGNVVGDNLIKLGYFVINVKESGTASDSAILLKKTPNVASVGIFALDGGSFKVESDTTQRTQYTIDVNTTIHITPDNKTFRIIVGAKYKEMNTINISNPNVFMDLRELNYINSLEYFTMPTNELNYGDITHVLSLPMVQVSCYNNANVTGSVDGLKDNNELTTILMAFTGIEGNIANVNGRSIATIRFKGTNVNGALEDFCEAQISNGRGSSSISITIPSTVTLNNVGVDPSKTYTVTFSGSGCSVSNGSSTIATYDGTNWSY